MEFLVPGAELLGAATVGEESPKTPRGVIGAADFGGHLGDNLVAEGIGVDEEEAGIKAGKGRDEVAGVAEGD